MNKLGLSIIMPVFNEEKNIPRVIEKYKEISKKINLEIIFVEDTGSSDKTREVLKKESNKEEFVKKLFINERGYGISIYEGLKIAKGEFIGWTHADLQTDPNDVLKAFKIIKKESKKEIYVKGKRIKRPFFDKIINTLGMSIFETLILGKFMYDINAQPNIFHKSLLLSLKNPPKDFAFDLYVYFIAKKMKYKIIRFPVIFGKRIFGESAWNTGWKARIKFIKRTINFTFKLKKNLEK